MPTLTEHAAELLFNFANIFLFLGAAFVFGGAFLVAWTSPIKDHYASERVSANERDTAKANEKAATATNEAAAASERAASAHERAATLEKEASEAKLALAKLQSQLSWRHLRPEQATALADALRGHPMHIEFSILAGDPEVESYANELITALNASGSVSGNATSAIFTGAVVGLRMSKTDSPEARLLEAALRRADIPFTFSGATPELRMSVGTKPRE